MPPMPTMPQVAQIAIPFKDGYVPSPEIDERTTRALTGDARQLTYDAETVEDFINGEWPVIKSILSKRKGNRVLDVGCGYGRHAPYLTSMDCAQYLGIDPNADRIAYARQHIWPRLPRGLGEAKMFERADILAFNFGEQVFDFIWCCTVLQHLSIEAKLAACARIRSLLAPGGVALLDEGMIRDETLDQCRTYYYSPACPSHMIPMPLSMLREAFVGHDETTVTKGGTDPFIFRRISGHLFQVTRGR